MRNDEWHGTAPVRCDWCKRLLTQCGNGQTFVDGATVLGMWGIIGQGCEQVAGVRIGTGLGQRYNIHDNKKIDG